MLYISASASGSKLSPTHYTGLTIRHLNGACEKATVCAMPDGHGVYLELLNVKGVNRDLLDSQSGKPHITKGFEVHF